jgi:GTPase SAR1 family protein
MEFVHKETEINGKPIKGKFVANHSKQLNSGIQQGRNVSRHLGKFSFLKKIFSKSYYRGAKGAIVVYDVNVKESFDSSKSLLEF